jgi:hypothetical protein
MTYSYVKNIVVVHTSTARLRPKVVLLNVADPESGIECFFDLWIRDGKNPDPG